MKLVLLTNAYPYGDQEAFIEPEMKILEKFFDEIHILTFATPGSEVTRYVPMNTKVTLVRQNGDGFGNSVLQMLSPKAWKEVRFASKYFHYSLRSCASLQLNFYGKANALFQKYLEKEDKADTIFYSYWLSHLSYALIRFKQNHPEAFCISRAHRFDNFIDFKASLYRREILTTLNGVFPISLEGLKEIEERILPHVGQRHAELKVFHLGVSFTDTLNPAEKQDEMQIVSCSFIHRIKRLDILVDALSKIESIPIHWTHFGGGQDEAKIRSMADEKLGKKTNIRYELRGQTAHDDILDYYTKNHVDLFVNSSDHEGIPVSIMEAMAAGIICVARDVGGNRELISDQENGFLLDQDADEDEYARLITNVYSMDQNKLSFMKKNAMSKVRKDFASPTVYEDFADYLIKAFHSFMTA